MGSNILKSFREKTDLNQKSFDNQTIYTLQRTYKSIEQVQAEVDHLNVLLHENEILLDSRFGISQIKCDFNMKQTFSRKLTYSKMILMNNLGLKKHQQSQNKQQLEFNLQNQKLNIDQICICLTFFDSQHEDQSALIKVRLLDLYHFHIFKQELIKFFDETNEEIRRQSVNIPQLVVSSRNVKDDRNITGSSSNQKIKLRDEDTNFSRLQIQEDEEIKEQVDENLNLDAKMLKDQETDFVMVQRIEKLRSIAKQCTEDNECSICMNSHVNIVLPCMHQFCENCITDWYMKNESCPQCRKTENIEGYYMVSRVENSLIKTLFLQ
eukprot:403350166